MEKRYCISLLLYDQIVCRLSKDIGGKKIYEWIAMKTRRRMKQRRKRKNKERNCEY